MALITARLIHQVAKVENWNPHSELNFLLFCSNILCNRSAMYTDPYGIEDDATASVNYITCCIQQCASTSPYNLTPIGAPIF
eukprot:2939142-Ditylum_brightwellii.AAC.1